MPETVERYKAPNGHTRYRIKMPCVNCGKIRKVDLRSRSSSKFTGLCKECHRKQQIGKKHPMYRGGRWNQSAGYIGVLVSADEPFAAMRDIRGYVYEHRLNMAKHLGRSLTKYEHVHHINGDRTDNRISNLELISSATHRLISQMQTRIKQLEQEVQQLRQQLRGEDHYALQK